MKWTMMATETAIQFNLEPENPHERKLLETLSEHNGIAVLHKGVSVAECQGGYLRNFGERSNTLAITVHTTPPEAPGHGE